MVRTQLVLVCLDVSRRFNVRCHGGGTCILVFRLRPLAPVLLLGAVAPMPRQTKLYAGEVDRLVPTPSLRSQVHETEDFGRKVKTQAGKRLRGSMSMDHVPALNGTLPDAGSSGDLRRRPIRSNVARDLDLSPLESLPSRAASCHHLARGTSSWTSS
jgi:hypothetical protein